MTDVVLGLTYRESTALEQLLLDTVYAGQDEADTDVAALADLLAKVEELNTRDVRLVRCLCGNGTVGHADCTMSELEKLAVWGDR